jgi:nucleoid-associated protein YgaU
MGCARQAVLEFDEEVRAPWRPRLVVVAAADPSPGELAPEPILQTYPSRRSSSRVGACRPSRSAGTRPTDVRGRRERSAQDLSVAPAARPARAPRPRARLRLTRRARRFALVLALAAGVALGSWLAPLVGVGGGGGLRMAGVTTVVVQPGDTLWSIASPVAGGGDVRPVVAQIRRLNALSSARLVPGQTLQLP